MALLARGEYVTLGKFVEVVHPEVLDRVAEAIEDSTALLTIAAAIEARHRLDDLVARIDALRSP